MLYQPIVKLPVGGAADRGGGPGPLDAGGRPGRLSGGFRSGRRRHRADRRGRRVDHRHCVRTSRGLTAGARPGGAAVGGDQQVGAPTARPGFPGRRRRRARRHGVPAGLLTVEITETAVFGGGLALATVHALARLGASIALDHFGAGRSSLGLLRIGPVDVVKVDKSFVDGLGDTPQQEAIVTALTGFARTMACGPSPRGCRDRRSGPAAVRARLPLRARPPLRAADAIVRHQRVDPPEPPGDRLKILSTPATLRRLAMTP